jgi:hypothetical protein
MTAFATHGAARKYFLGEDIELGQVVVGGAGVLIGALVFQTLL